jgi:hypothetical protein
LVAPALVSAASRVGVGNTEVSALNPAAAVAVTAAAEAAMGESAAAAAAAVFLAWRSGAVRFGFVAAVGNTGAAGAVACVGTAPVGLAVAVPPAKAPEPGAAGSHNTGALGEQAAPPEGLVWTAHW